MPLPVDSTVSCRLPKTEGAIALEIERGGACQGESWLLVYQSSESDASIEVCLGKYLLLSAEVTLGRVGKSRVVFPLKQQEREGRDRRKQES